MGYRPVEQSIEDPLRKILEGMNEFDAAVRLRIGSGDWKAEHLEEIDELSRQLSKYRIKMTRLAEDNW